MNYLFYFILICILILWIEGIPHFLPNFMLTQKKPGEELEIWLKNFHWGGRQDIGDKILLPSYKFYTEVVEVLLFNARKMGGSYLDSFLFLREGLQADLQFEKKVKEVILGMFLHMSVMMILTWSFIFSALSMVEVKTSHSQLFGILFWQLMGLGLIPVLVKFYRKRYFSDIGKVWRVLLILKSLLRVPLPQSEVFSFAGVNGLEQIRQKSLIHIVQKLQSSCQKTLRLGLSYENDVKGLMEELRFQEKWHFDLFEKRLNGIKLLLLSVFFLPSYLMFVFILLNDLKAII